VWFCGDSKEQTTDGTADIETVHANSDEKEDSTGNWNRGHSSSILTKNLSALSLAWDFVEAEFKGDRLINWVEENTRQHSIQVMTWLLLPTFSLIVGIGSRKTWKTYNLATEPSDNFGSRKP
jgi:hypothetical protein